MNRVTAETPIKTSIPVRGVMEVLGFLIEKYEDEHVPEITES